MSFEKRSLLKSTLAQTGEAAAERALATRGMPRSRREINSEEFARCVAIGGTSSIVVATPPETGA